MYAILAAKPVGVTDELSPKETIHPLNLEQIQQVAQKQKATIVEYSIINLDHLFIWVIKPSGKITFHPVHLQPLRQEQNTSLSELVHQARESLEVPEKRHDAPRLLRQLHEILIEPIASLLPTDPNVPVIFIPQGNLFLVPFPALQDANGKFLIEQHTIVTAPSIQVMDLTHQRRQQLGARSLESLKPQDVLVAGNPTMPSIAPVIGEPPQQLAALPAAGAEANAIASFLNTQAILGARATKVDIMQQMPKARLIHLATHGLLDDIRQLGVPGAIALAPSSEDNGFLTAGEILELKLNAELVVLSACVTGLGKLTGDGVIGLSRCLMAAGVPRLIVSLWPVSDLSTAFLMINFYENLKNFTQLQPGDVAKAFNQSQKWLLNLTSEEAKQELEKLKSHIYQAFAGISKRLAEARINRYFQDICDRAPHPFANPVYWSAFTTIGL